MVQRVQFQCLVLSVVMVALAACGNHAGDRTGGPGGRGNQAIPVEIAVAHQQHWRDELRALGTVHAHEAVTLTAKVSETVQQVHFESGQEIARGAPLVTLSGTQQQAALASAQAQLQDAQQQFVRLDALAKQQLVARSALDAARATRDAAQAQVAQVRANLSDRVIRAPFAGVLGIRQVSPGALVTPGTVIATLDDIARVYVDFPVPETDLAEVTSGQTLSGTVAAYPGQQFEGKVATVAARLDADTRAATVRGDFSNAGRKLKPGMLVNVSILRSTRLQLVVPELAVQQIGTETFVWRVKPNGTVEKADVDVGGRVPGWVMLKRGIEMGDRIITEGTGKLQPGASVVEGSASKTAVSGK